MVNVVRSNFLEKSQDLIDRLPTAAYAAIDLEMTGITIPGTGRPTRDDTPQDRYPKLRPVPERYSIIQVGVALFHENPDFRAWVEAAGGGGGSGEARNESGGTGGVDGGYSSDDNSAQQQQQQQQGGGEEPPEFLVRKYNFYLFAPPPPTTGYNNSNSNDANATREVVLNPSTIQFLNKHNMDWNKWTREGVPFVTVDRAAEILDSFKTRHDRLEEEEAASRLAKAGSGSSSSNAAVDGAGAGGGEGGPNKGPRRDRVRLTRADDVAFVARTMAGLREWIDSAIRPPPPEHVHAHVQPPGHENDQQQQQVDGDETQNNPNDEEDEVEARLRRERLEGKSLLLPSCNAFLRRALYESIEEEYPTLLLERADGGHIRVLRLSDAEKAQRTVRLKHEEWNKIHREQIGFTDVFRALSAACRGRLVEGPDGKAVIVNTGPSSDATDAAGADADADATDDNDTSTDGRMKEEGFSRFNPEAGTLRLFDSKKVMREEDIKPGPIVTDGKRGAKKKKGKSSSSSTRKPTSIFKMTKKKKKRKATKEDKNEDEEEEAAAATTNKSDGTSAQMPTEPRHVPIIVHNGLMDLLFLLTHFHSPSLPPTYDEAKKLIHSYFPNIYDTKILSTECSDADVRMGNTALGELFKSVCGPHHMDDGDDAVNFDEDDGRLYTVQGEAATDEDDPGQMHEAAYDAFMTGAVFQYLCRRIIRSHFYKNKVSQGRKGRRSNGGSHGYGGLEFLSVTRDSNPPGPTAGSTVDEAGSFFGRNKIYLMTTMYTIDLENEHGDDLSKGMLPETTFRVSGIEPSIKTRDIMVAIRSGLDRELATGSGSAERPSFDIVWIDDVTFMVATRSPNDGSEMGSFLISNDRTEIIQRHGKVIESVLRKVYANQTVISLKEHLEKRSNAGGGSEGTDTSSGGHGVFRGTIDALYDMASNLAGSVLGKRRRDNEDVAEESARHDAPAKRRRIVE